MLYVAIAAAWETFDKSNRTFAKLWWNSVLKGGDGHDGRMDWPIFRAMVRNRHAADPPGLAIGTGAISDGEVKALWRDCFASAVRAAQEGGGLLTSRSKAAPPTEESGIGMNDFLIFMRRCEAAAEASADEQPELLDDVVAALERASPRAGSPRGGIAAPRSTRQVERMKTLRAKDMAAENDASKDSHKARFLRTRAEPTRGPPDDGTGLREVADQALLALFFRGMCAALEQLPDPAQRSVGKLWFKYDRDNSGSIEWREFVEMVRNRTTRDPSGFGFSRNTLSDDQMKALWYSADEDGENEINIEEFRRFLRKCEQAAALEPVPGE